MVPAHSSHASISVSLKDTTFITVSAYQNVKLTQLKIDNNPFANRFRFKKTSEGVHLTTVIWSDQHYFQCITVVSLLLKLLLVNLNINLEKREHNLYNVVSMLSFELPNSPTKL